MSFRRQRQLVLKYKEHMFEFVSHLNSDEEEEGIPDDDESTITPDDDTDEDSEY